MFERAHAALRFDAGMAFADDETAQSHAASEHTAGLVSASAERVIYGTNRR